MAGIGHRTRPPGQQGRTGRTVPQRPHLVQTGVVDLRRPGVVPVRDVGPVVQVGRASRVGQSVGQARGSISRAGVADQLHRRIARSTIHRFVDARRQGRGVKSANELEHSGDARPQPLGGPVPGRRVVRVDRAVGVAVVEPVAQNAMPAGSDAGQDRRVVGRASRWGTRQLPRRVSAQPRSSSLATAGSSPSAAKFSRSPQWAPSHSTPTTQRA